MSAVEGQGNVAQPLIAGFGQARISPAGMVISTLTPFTGP